MPIFQDNHRQFSKNNPLMGYLLVYANATARVIESGAESSLEKLRRDKEALEYQLKTEKNLKKRWEINDEIKEINKQIKRLESLEPSKAPLALLHGLESNIKDLDDQIGRERDIARKKTLEARKITCLDALEMRQQKIEDHAELKGTLGKLQSDIENLEDQIKVERNPKRKKELEIKQFVCLHNLKERQRKIEDQTQLEDALDQISNDDFIIKSLDGKDFDYIHVEYLLSSDLEPFFGDKFRAQLAAAEEQMITSDFTKNTLRPQRDELVRKSDEEWFAYQKDVTSQIEKLKKERQGIVSKLDGKDLDVNQKRNLKNRLEWVDSTIPHLLKQANKRSEWTHGRVLQKEKELSRVSLLEDVSPEVLDKMKSFMQEARFMRAEKIREYLGAKYDELLKLFETKKKEKIFGKSTVQAMEKDFKEFKRLLIDQRQDDPETLKQLARNLNTAEMQLNMSAEEIAEIKKNRPQIEKEVLDGFAGMESLIAQFKPEELNRFKDELLKDEQKRLKAIEEKSAKNAKTKYDERAGVSRIYKKAIGVIDEFVDEGSPLRKHLAEFKERLQKIGEMEPEELQAVKQDLALLKPKLELFKNLDQNIEKALGLENEDVRNAHQAIIDIQGAVDTEEIQQVLNRTIGSDHFEAVSRSVFEDEYRKYTPNIPKDKLAGKMVFYQREDEFGNILEWKIIVDEEALKDPKNVEDLKKQFTHELLHLEFEKSDDVKKQVRDLLTKHEKWESKKDERGNIIEKGIKDTAIEKFGSKKPPSGGDKWTDDDILSELYAMQNEIGNVWAPGDSADARLNNLFTGVGLASGLKDAAEKIKGYEKGIEKIRGMEGMDAGGDLGAVEGGEGGGAVGSYEEFQNNIEMQGNRIKDLKKSEFLGFVPGASGALGTLEKMHKNTKELNEYFKDHRDNTILAAGVGDSIDQLKKGVDEVEKALGKASEKTPNLEIGPLRKLWNNTSFLSLNDMVQTLIDVKEYVSRRHNRKKNDHAARLGMALFQNTNMGREAYARRQKAEMEEVQEWQGRYENLDAWQLLDEIKAMASKTDPSKDQLKAVLRLLAQKGRIDWRYPPLWLVLNKLQNAVHLTPDDPILMHSPPLMRQKLHAALGEIWDYDEFLSLERQNESSYDGELRKYLPSYDRMQDQLTERLDQLLKMYRQGKKVDPMEYESIMVYSIEKGKSFAENIMFHLMVGMAEGLLTQDRGLALDKYLNNWPATQWIYSKSPPLTREEYKYICQKYFKSDYDAGTITGDHGMQFKNFYWVHVQNDSMTIQRVRKSVSERQWDHDWTRSIACLGDANTAKRFFAGKSGQQEAKDTGVENAYAGALQWLEENAVDPSKINFRHHFARMAGWIGMAEGIMDRVAYYRGDTDISTRANESMENAVAREQQVTNHKDWTMRQNRKRMQEFLDDLDPYIFAYLRTKKDVREKEEKAELGQEVKAYLMQKYPQRNDEWQHIEHIDDVYERMDLIIKTIFDSLSDAQIKAKISRLKVHQGK